MALVVFMCGEEKARTSSFRAERKPWMLKDYLGDDLSSCSSNGFRSFPRRQCCVAVRNIIEKEVVRTGRNNNHSKAPKRMLVRNRSISSTLQRASMAVINAVKFLPFSSDSKNSSQLSDGNRFLSRSFSKKLFRKSLFWKKERKNNNGVVIKKNKDDHEKFDDEIEEWISSGVVGKEKYQPLDLSNDTTVTNVSTTSISNSDGKSDSSWPDDITFTSDSSENDVVEEGVKIEVEKEEVSSNSDGVLTGEASVGPAEFVEETLCFNEEAEKEQSSPVSVLDFPYDHDDGDSSPFTLRVSRLKGSTERLMKKLGRFECLAGLEPVNLETLISSIEIEDRSPKCSIQPCPTPSYVSSSESDYEEEEEESHESEVEKHAQNLLNITKAKMGPKITHKIDLENLLLDFFRENVTQKTNDSMLKGAEDWLNGHYDKLILGWEVEGKRQAYIRDMDEGGWWPRDTILEREEVAFKLGDEVLAYLIQEFMIELSSS
ncbi:uncharacterized protein LOC130800529 [Amaranthus tricolor]|uniref:uncharacterized protein LOC130800529 n=1 Tax=Amaranthus tricolor TaxID=29722 RepID=UPI002588481B|nr:uncharacterized protein LOC130800529 [Amaranthus tricolor]